MTKHNFHNTTKEGTIQERITKYGISALTNAEYAANFKPFIDACEKAGIFPSARQAGKYRQKKGMVYNA